MSKQLAVSAAFSIFMMVTYVLFGGDAARRPLEPMGTIASPVEISAPELPDAGQLLPSLR
ncbi:MAG: hypothetical protein JF595_13325 [Sphingomonadales bacterium]|nr:hypothetical protein [Sphingomonadales bacterium]